MPDPSAFHPRCAAYAPTHGAVGALERTLDLTYDVRFYLSTDKNITTSDVLLSTNTGAFQPAATLGKFTKTITLPAGTPRGSVRYIGWIADFNNAIPERMETNNWAFVNQAVNVCP